MKETFKLPVMVVFGGIGFGIAVTQFETLVWRMMPILVLVIIMVVVMATVWLFNRQLR